MAEFSFGLTEGSFLQLNDQKKHLKSVAEDLISNYYLLTGCKGRTRKYKPKVFHTARACEACLENQRLVFPGTARASS